MEHLQELLKQKFTGVRSDVLAQLSASLMLVATTEEEQNAAVEKLTQAQVEAFGKSYRKSVDSEVSNSTKTFEENLKKKYDVIEKGKYEILEKGKYEIKSKDDITIEESKTTTPAKKEADKQIPNLELESEIKGYKSQMEAQQKALDEAMEQIKMLNGQIADINTKSVVASRKAVTDALLERCKDETLKSVIEQQLPLMKSLDDEAFGKTIETLNVNVDKSNQLFAERSLPNTPPSVNVKVDETKVSQSMKEYVERMNGKTDK